MISIVTSLYHAEQYLPRFLKNLAKFQKELSRQNISFESLIIANEPTVGEKVMLKEFGDSPWFKVVEVAREPLYASWNRGVEMATSSVIGFWNVDDERFSKAAIDGLSRLNAGADLIYFPFIYKRYVKVFGLKLLVKRVVVQPLIFQREEFIRSMHCGPFFMFKKNFYQKVGPFDEQFKIAGDFEWCVRAAKIGNFSLSSEIGGIFVNEGSSLSGGYNPVQFAENNIIYIRHHISGKTHQVSQELLKQYDPNKIFYTPKI